MKRALSVNNNNNRNTKRAKAVVIKDSEEDEVVFASAETRGSVYLDDNVLFEVLKHVDARSLAAAGCVSKQWRTTARDERLWELICTKQWAYTGCGEEQLRSVVLALGGFRRLHALFLWPLSKPPAHAPLIPHVLGSTPPLIPHVLRSKPRWDKDEVHLALALLSVRYYEKMSFHYSKQNT